MKRIGIDHVALSSGFNHGGGVIGWSDESELPNVTAEVKCRGYTPCKATKYGAETSCASGKLRSMRATHPIDRCVDPRSLSTTLESISGKRMMKRLIAAVAVALAVAMLAGCSKHDTVNTSDENTLVSGDYADGNSDQFDNRFDGNLADAAPPLSSSGDAF